MTLKKIPAAKFVLIGTVVEMDPDDFNGLVVNNDDIRVCWAKSVNDGTAIRAQIDVLMPAPDVLDAAYEYRADYEPDGSKVITARVYKFNKATFKSKGLAVSTETVTKVGDLVI